MAQLIQGNIVCANRAAEKYQKAARNTTKSHRGVWQQL
jgi:hypothetical protein